VGAHLAVVDGEAVLEVAVEREGGEVVAEAHLGARDDVEVLGHGGKLQLSAHQELVGARAETAAQPAGYIGVRDGDPREGRHGRERDQETSRTETAHVTSLEVEFRDCVLHRHYFKITNLPVVVPSGRVTR